MQNAAATVANMQDVVYNHTYEIFRDKSLPPLCVDSKARIEAQRFVWQYTQAGRLTDFFMRYIGGAL